MVRNFRLELHTLYRDMYRIMIKMAPIRTVI